MPYGLEHYKALIKPRQQGLLEGNELEKPVGVERAVPGQEDILYRPQW